MACWVVAGRLPTRVGEIPATSHPSVSALDAIFLRSRSQSSRTAVRVTAERVKAMEQEQTTAEQDLVTESLVEEVSIDGMCGVY